MKGWVLERTTDLLGDPNPLVYRELEDPQPGPEEIRIRVTACGVCHTELDEIEGRVHATFPVVPGHQVVGRVEMTGSDVTHFTLGERVGVAWIYSACGHCSYCRSGRENLCCQFRGTGRDVNGGYAELMTVSQDFSYSIPDEVTDTEAAPLLCAGAIGYRSLRLAELENGSNLGLTGFGGSGHLVLKLVRQVSPATKVFVFARNPVEQDFARDLGAAWAGAIDQPSPEQLHAVIDTTPAWAPVLCALANLAPAGRLIINAIRKESADKHALLDLNYAKHLWQEKEIKSVANVTRRDVAEFLKLVSETGIRPEIEVYPFENANRALYDLKTRKIKGAKVLQVP